MATKVCCGAELFVDPDENAIVLQTKERTEIFRAVILLPGRENPELECWVQDRDADGLELQYETN